MYFLRKLYKLQQADMPNYTGISRGTWSDYENNKTEPNLATLIKIAEFFGVSIDVLVRKEISTDVHLIKILESRKPEDIVQGNVHPIVHLYGANEDVSYVAEPGILSSQSSIGEIVEVINKIQRDIDTMRRLKGK